METCCSMQSLPGDGLFCTGCNHFMKLYFFNRMQSFHEIIFFHIIIYIHIKLIHVLLFLYIFYEFFKMMKNFVSWPGNINNN